MRYVSLWAAIVVVAAACSNGGGTAATSTSLEATTTTTAAVTTTTAAASSTSGPAAGVDTVVEIAVANGEVTPGGTVEVPLGDRVRIMVTADTDDEVHIHGYDLMAPVSPEAPAVIDFDATIPGIFEIELEDSGLALVELEVR